MAFFVGICFSGCIRRVLGKCNFGRIEPFATMPWTIGFSVETYPQTNFSWYFLVDRMHSPGTTFLIKVLDSYLFILAKLMNFEEIQKLKYNLRFVSEMNLCSLLF